MLTQEIEASLMGYFAEDAGMGDPTAEMTPQRECRAAIIANEKCTVAGIEEITFLLKNAGLGMRASLKDGQKAEKGTLVAEIAGSNRKILTLERVCLNILGRMSGVATLCTLAREKVEQKWKSRAGKRSLPKIAVTRKTVPGFQLLDKKAAEAAGCWTHRKNLAEMILLKDNHLAFFPDAFSAARKAKETGGRRFEVEVESEAQALEAAAAQPDMILLDNFLPKDAGVTIKTLRKKGFRGQIELSGGITLKNIGEYINLGADVISMGELTKNARIIDFSLEIAKVH